MKLGDIVALAKAGYSVSEVKELLEMEPKIEEPEQEQPEQEQEQPEDSADLNEEEPDYKAMYEESQKKLQEAQKLNLQKEVVVDNDKEMNALADAIRGFM